MNTKDTAPPITMTCVWNGDRLSVTLTDGAQTFTDKCDPCSRRSRETLCKAAAAKLHGLDTDELDRELQRELATHSQPKPTPEADDPSAAADAELAKTPADVLDEARAMLTADDLLARVAADLVDIGIVGEHELAMMVYLLGTSRLLSKPLAAIVQGSSSSGKSFVADSTASLFPREERLLATDMTTNALYYLKPGALRHKFVVAGERSRVEDDARAEATRALREMLASGSLRKLLPVKNGDHIETQIIESAGPIAFIESTTLADIFEEDRNRCLLLASDDSGEQTAAVVASIAARAAGGVVADVERIRARHHAAQRMLRRCSVQVPFAPALAARMPTDRPEARRAMTQLLGVVQAVALLHQFQRVDVPQHRGLIVATVADYMVARALVAAPLARSLGGELPGHVLSLGRWILATVPSSDTFTVASLVGREGCRWSRTMLYDLAKPLRSSGFLIDAGTDGKANRYRRAATLAGDAETWLPKPEDIRV